jgi:hypothetical protein
VFQHPISPDQFAYTTDKPILTNATALSSTHCAFPRVTISSPAQALAHLRHSTFHITNFSFPETIQEPRPYSTIR